jgi:hypothetical protein
MKYYDGTEVQVGDIVTVQRDKGQNVAASVLKIILPQTEEAEQWSLPEGGVLMEGGGLGAFSSTSLEEDTEIEFVHRARE